MHARVRGIRSLATIAPIFSLKNDDDPTMSNLTPPQAPATWTHTPEQVTTLVNELIAKDRALWDKVGSLPPEECTFESVRSLSTCQQRMFAEQSWDMDRSSLSNLYDNLITDRSAHPSPSDQLAIAHGDAEMESLSEPLLFYQNVSTSKELRDAANAAEVLLREYGIEISMRLDIYQAKINAEKNIKASGRKLNPEEERLVEKLVLDGKRAGLDLPDKERKELEKLKKELSQICVEFNVSLVLDYLHCYSGSG